MFRPRPIFLPQTSLENARWRRNSSYIYNATNNRLQVSTIVLWIQACKSVHTCSVPLMPLSCLRSQTQETLQMGTDPGTQPRILVPFQYDLPPWGPNDPQTQDLPCLVPLWASPRNPLKRQNSPWALSPLLRAVAQSSPTPIAPYPGSAHQQSICRCPHESRRPRCGG